MGRTVAVTHMEHLDRTCPNAAASTPLHGGAQILWVLKPVHDGPSPGLSRVYYRFMARVSDPYAQDISRTLPVSKLPVSARTCCPKPKRFCRITNATEPLRRAELAAWRAEGRTGGPYGESQTKGNNQIRP
jgi:hypothetical protein